MSKQESVEHYEYNGGLYTRAGLEQAVNQAVAVLDPEQWHSGTFEFEEWLSDAVITGTVTRIKTDL